MLNTNSFKLAFKHLKESGFSLSALKQIRNAEDLEKDDDRVSSSVSDLRGLTTRDRERMILSPSALPFLGKIRRIRPDDGSSWLKENDRLFLLVSDSTGQSSQSQDFYLLYTPEVLRDIDTYRRLYSLRSLYETPSNSFKSLLVDGAVLQAALDMTGEINRINSDVESTAIRHFRTIVEYAVRLNASDIHLIAKRHERSEVLFRVDGELSELTDHAYTFDELNAIQRSLYNAKSQEGAASSSSHSSNLEQRTAIPWEVTLSADRKAKLILRYEYAPKQYGFKVVLRITWADGSKAFVPGDSLKIDIIKKLGHMPDQAAIIEDRAFNKGITFLTGPVGSGKSTALMVLLSHVAKRTNVDTIEDPIECTHPSMHQSNLIVASGESEDDAYARMIKSLLRQDIDVVMVSEVRARAAATALMMLADAGHPTFSTLHARDSFGVFGRLSNEGVGIPLTTLCEPGIINMIVCQDLVQLLCPDCSMLLSESSDPADKRLLARLQKEQLIPTDRIRIRNHHHKDHTECPGGGSCKGKGIIGRTACAEVLVPTRQILDAIASHNTPLANYLYRKQKRPLTEPSGLGKTALEVALYRVQAGVVDPNEAFARFESLDSYLKRLADEKAFAERFEREQTEVSA